MAPVAAVPALMELVVMAANLMALTAAVAALTVVEMVKTLIFLGVEELEEQVV
jgi:hypothetical protein